MIFSSHGSSVREDGRVVAHWCISYESRIKSTLVRSLVEHMPTSSPQLHSNVTLSRAVIEYDALLANGHYLDGSQSVLLGY